MKFVLKIPTFHLALVDIKSWLLQCFFAFRFNFDAVGINETRCYS